MLASGIFDKVIISSDDPVFERAYKLLMKLNFYKEHENLAGDDATTDMVVDFFFEEFPSCESIFGSTVLVHCSQ